MDERSKHAPHVEIDLDPVLRVIGWNRRAEQVFGLAEAGALGRDIGEVVPLVDGAWTRMLAADSAAPQVCAVARPDQPLQLAAWWRVTRDADGRLTGATIYGHADRNATLAEQMLAAIVNNLDISVWAVDRDGVYLYQDGKAMGAAGLVSQQFRGQSIFTVFGDHPGLGVVRQALAGEARLGEEVEVMGVQWKNWYIPVADSGPGEAALVAISLDMTEAFRREAELRAKLNVIEQQQEVIRELSTPIIEVWDGVITLPIMGLVDSVRTAEIMDNLLHTVTRLRVRYAILDLTGVEVVDTGTASHLIGMIQAIRLLGAEGILTGIHPSIAQTVVSLGLDLSHVSVYARLRDALQHCIAQINTNKRRT